MRVDKSVTESVVLLAVMTVYYTAVMKAVHSVCKMVAL